MKREEKAYPINYLRSVALRNTRTEIVMYLEEGYMIPSTLRTILMADLYFFINNYFNPNNNYLFYIFIFIFLQPHVYG